MGYRSERFEVGQMAGLGQAFGVIDGLESRGFVVEQEVMAGTSYRRQLAESALEGGFKANYVLQAVLSLPPPAMEGARWTLGQYLEESRSVIRNMELPGRKTSRDLGCVVIKKEALAPFGAPRSEDNIVDVFPPWAKASWSEQGKSCLFFCGIRPPQPKGFWEEYRFNWDERQMRRGRVLFRPTPAAALELATT